MGVLDQITGEAEATTPIVDGLSLQSAPSPTAAPKSALRNRAAITASLSSDPAKVLENYQGMMAQAEQGGDTSVQHSLDSFFREDKSRDMSAVMSVLSDRNVGQAQKQAAIEAMRVSPMLKDSGHAVLTKGLESSSDGETIEAEDSRINTSELIRDMYKAREDTQALVNAYGAKLPDLDVKVAAGMVESALMPFATGATSYRLAKAIKEAQGGKLSLWETVKALTFGAGTVAMDMREKLAAVPPKDRVAYNNNLLEIIKNNSAAIFPTDNGYNQFMRTQAAFEEGGYSSTDEFVDNATFLLDIFGVGQGLRVLNKAHKAGKAAKVTETAHIAAADKAATYVPAGKGAKATAAVDPIVDSIKRIEINSYVRQENPSSLANITQQANPEKARGLHAAVFKSEGDAAAEAVYGVSKTQAIINDVFPQAITESRAVTTKAVDIQRPLRIDPDVSDEIKALINESDVSIHYTQATKAIARSNIVNDFSHATDLVPNDAMGSFSSGFKLDGSFVDIGAVYGTKEGAFLRADEAITQAEYALRGQGITRDNVELLARRGLDYVPVNLEDVRDIEGSYLVRINTRREIDPTDIYKMVEGKKETYYPDKETVRFNFFDRFQGAVWNKTGSISRWLMFPSTMLPPRLTGSAVVATDITSRFEKKMIEIASRFSDPYNKLPADRKVKIDNCIKEANFKGLAYDVTKLTAEGFSASEMGILRQWRNFWDAHYVLENHDAIRTLSSQGFQLFKDANTELYARPVAKNSNLGKVYDPTHGVVVDIDPAALDDLYSKGGTIAKLRRPTQFTSGVPAGAGGTNVGETVEYMVVRNTPSESLRRFNDTDTVLNYREGYYQIQYKAARFVDEITVENGKEIRRAVAVAGDTQEAQHFVNRQQRNNPDKKYEIRADDKGISTGSDDWFDLNAARGRIAQKQRGKLLEDATGINHLGDGTYIVNPVESAIRASKSISGRTVNRPMLEAARAKFLHDYAEVSPPNGIGGRSFPSSVEQIGAKGKQNSELTADARSTWEHINYLENGYINSIDDFVKGTLNSMAQMLGEAGHGKAERFTVGAADVLGHPTQTLKSTVFNATLGTNIVRNWVIQPMQALRTFSYNPAGSANVARLAGEWGVGKVGGEHLLSDEGKEFFRFMDLGGVLDSVDKQNMVRGTLLDAAGSSSKTMRAAGKLATLPRQIGYDVGEGTNMLIHSASVFDRWKRMGKDMTDINNIREAHSELRAISYDMNFAEDAVYNQTWPALLLQFMQVPHKSALQLLNRRVDWKISARMAGADIMLFGVPGAAIISEIVGGDILPENDKLRETVLDGVTSVALNNLFSEIAGEAVEIDFDSLSPYGAGWAKQVYAIVTGSPQTALMNSPAGQMFLKDGGKFQSVLAQAGRFFSPWEDVDRSPEEAKAIVNEVLSLTSGWSNAMKMRQALALGKSLDKKGVVIDPKVNNVEAIALMAGFPTRDTRAMYETLMTAAEGTKAYQDEVRTAYKHITQYYQNAHGAGLADLKQQQAVIGQLLTAYGDSPEAMAIISKELEKDLAGKDNQLMRMILKNIGLPDHAMTIDEIRNAPISDDLKAKYISILDDFKNARKEIKKDK